MLSVFAEEKPELAALELKLQQQIASLGEKNSMTLGTMDELFMAFYKAGDYTKAAALGEKMLQLRRDTFPVYFDCLNLIYREKTH